MVLYRIIRFMDPMKLKKRSRETGTCGRGEAAEDLAEITALVFRLKAFKHLPINVVNDSLNPKCFFWK